MKREKILEELKKINVKTLVPINLDNLDDKHLELRLKILKSMSDSADKELEE